MHPQGQGCNTEDNGPTDMEQVDVSSAPEALQKVEPSLLRLYAFPDGYVTENEVLTRHPIIMYT